MLSSLRCWVMECFHPLSTGDSLYLDSSARGDETLSRPTARANKPCAYGVGDWLLPV